MGSYDHAKRRKVQRRGGRERGVWAYIPAEELARADRDPDGPLTYRVWGTGRGGVLIRLYDEERVRA